MGRRDRDPRPPVEVVGGDSDDAHVQTVAVGGGSGSRSRRLLAAGTVVAVLVGGLVLGDPGDDDPSDATEVDGADGGDETERDEQRSVDRATTTTRRPRPTTTTTQPVPVLPGSSVRVLLIGGPGGAEILHLGTGQRTSVDLSQAVYSAVLVSGGIVALDGREARFHPLTGGEAVGLGAADQVFPHRDPTAVWLLVPSMGDPERPATTAVVVDVDGRVRSDPISWDEGWVVGVSLEGLIGQAGGRVYEVVPGRAPRPITVGEPLAVSDGRLMVRTCDDGGVCGIEVWDRALRSSRPVDVPPVGGPFYGVTLAVKPGTDRAALQQFGPRGSTLSLVDLSGGPHRLVSGMGELSGIAWLPGELGLLVLQGNRLARVFEQGDEIVIEQLAGVGQVEQFVVIPG